MTKEEVIQKFIDAGINKGYKLDNPHDWYNSFSQTELKTIFKNLRHIYKYFTGTHEAIRAIFPEYNFLEWKFKNISDGYFNKTENKILYLKWVGNKYNLKTLEDWYKIKKEMFLKPGGKGLVILDSFEDILKLMFPDKKFDCSKFNKTRDGFWDDFNVLKTFLLKKSKDFGGRMLTQEECLKFRGLNNAIIKHGGITKVAEELGLNIVSRYKTLSGNIVKSRYEVFVDNFLFLNNINFQYETKVFENSNFLCDFKLNNYYIEIWGYTGKNYDSKRKIKQELYSLNKLNLISFETSFFNSSLQEINDKLKEIIIKNDIKKSNFYNENLNKMISFESYDKDKILLEMFNECKRLKIKKFPSQRWWIKNGFNKHVYFVGNNHISKKEIVEKFIKFNNI